MQKLPGLGAGHLPHHALWSNRPMDRSTNNLIAETIMNSFKTRFLTRPAFRWLSSLRSNTAMNHMQYSFKPVIAALCAIFLGSCVGGPTDANSIGMHLLGNTPPPNVQLFIGSSKSVPGSLTLDWSPGNHLQAANVAGPWTTYGSSSPCTIAPTNSHMFFPVQVQ